MSRDKQLRHVDNDDTASETSTEECVHLIDNDTVQHKIRIEFADYGGSEVATDFADVLSQSEATDNALAEELAVAMRLRLPEIGIQPHTQVSSIQKNIIFIQRNVIVIHQLPVNIKAHHAKFGSHHYTVRWIS